MAHVGFDRSKGCVLGALLIGKALKPPFLLSACLAVLCEGRPMCGLFSLFFPVLLEISRHALFVRGWIWLLGYLHKP